jgi:branched-chain amino acid transport system substrate-binding protein
MPSFRLLLLVIYILATGVLLGACEENEGGGSAGTLRVEVGVVQSLSGEGSIYGRSALQGIELAVDEINEAEDGVEMTITLVDDGGSVDAGVAGFETLAGRGVTAIIGPTLSNVALEAMPVAQRASVPVLGATTTAQGITEIGDHIFRVALTEAVVVPATIARVHQDAPVQVAALIFDSGDAFSRSSADAMRAGIEAIGATIAAEVDVAQTDLASTFPDLHSKGLSTLLITPLIDKSVEIVQAVRGNGFQQTFIGGNSFNTPGIVEQAGSAVDGAYVGAAWNPSVDNAVSKRFVEAYTEKYGDAPDLFAAQGYSSVYLLLDAVERAGSVDRAAVRAALATLEDVDTALGSVSFSAEREAVHDPVVQRFEGGELVVLP